MIDLKKVIKGLESQLDDLSKYADADEVVTLTQDQAKDILVLLKGLKVDKTFKPLLSTDGWFCGNCWHLIAKPNEKLPEKCDNCETYVDTKAVKFYKHDIEDQLESIDAAKTEKPHLDRDGCVYWDSVLK